MSETEKHATSNDSLFESNFSEQASDPAPADAANTSASQDSNTDSDSSPSTANNDIYNENHKPLTEEELSKAILTIRSLVSSKEAGVIIGKNGKNVADLREQTGVKAGVSKSISGVPDRVLTVTGTLDGISRAYSMASNTLLESPLTPSYPSHISNVPPQGVATIRLLISHHQMGTIIGRQGAKIKSIQENSRVRMVASKELLKNSTERVVEVQGQPDAIQSAIWEIGRCLLEDADRGSNTIFYSPQLGNSPYNNNSNNNGNNNGNNYQQNNRYNSNGYQNGGNHHMKHNNRNNHYNNNNNTNNNNSNSSYRPKENDGPIYAEELPIPADMVGCIIGRGGSKISGIRRESGSQISIAKEPHDSTGDRMFTITGTRQSNQKALSLLFNQLENEKHRRTAEVQKQEA